jgi:rhodanese-related sulfurtransferase
MSKKVYWLFSVIMVLSMVLTACGGGAALEPAQPAEPEAPAVVEEPEAKAEEEEMHAEPEATVEADLDGAFTYLLANMTAYNTIKADGLLEAMVMDTPPFLLDVRTDGELEENGHIEGAVHIPLDQLAKNIDLLPDFDTPIVTYCGSGWRATIAMVALDAMGWNDVKALKVTFSDWKEAGNPVVEGMAPEAAVLDAASPDEALVAEMDAMLSNLPEGFGGISANDFNLALGGNPGVVVIDVRTAGEVEEKGSVDSGENPQSNIPLEEFIADKDLWPAMDDSIVVYCGSGHRSTIAMTILLSYGYTDVKSLKGGFGGWVDAGYATVGGIASASADLDGAFANLLANMDGYNTIRADGLLEAIAMDTPPFLLDVRTDSELEENGHIEGAVHIPLDQLAQNIDLLPDFDTPIVTYCGSGWRATIAMTSLVAMGWNDVKALKTTFADWVEAGNPVVAGTAPEAAVLNVATPDASLVAEMDAMLSNLPEGFGGISADDFNLALGGNPGKVVVDVRTASEVEEKGSIDTGDMPLINIPLEEFIVDKDMWPAADDSIVVYCGSGHRSTIAMTILLSYGYTDVKSLKNGFGAWVDAGYPTVGGMAPAGADLDGAFANLLATMEGYNTVRADDLLLELIEDTPPFLLDVRTASEVEENGHIEGAVHIPLQELGQNLNLLPDFDTPIVAYCGSGWRATIAMTSLVAMGWNDVSALKTTFADWAEAGNPVVAGLPEPGLELNAAQPDANLVAVFDAVLSNVPDGYGGVSADALNTALAENPDLILVDVRKLEELEENGVIEVVDQTLIHIPLEDFINQMDMWPAADADAVVYCGSGHRSTMAMTIMWAYNYTSVGSLKDGFGSWVSEGYPVAEYVAP